MRKVFLSSTGRDLAEHREAVATAIAELDGYHCVRMEHFGARDWEADDFCRAKVAECEVFLCIVGLLHGSCPPGSKSSFTEREYDAAVAAGRSCLIFVGPDDSPVRGNQIEDDAARKRQAAFRQRVATERTLGPFRSPEELARKVCQAIRNWEREWEVATGQVPVAAQPLLTDQAAATAEVQRVRALLEAMGYRVRAEREATAQRLVWLCQGKFGSEKRSDLVVYVPRAADTALIEWLRQTVVANPDLSRGVVIARASITADVREAARDAGRVDVFSLDEYESRLADFSDYAQRLKQEYEDSEIPALYVDLRCRPEKEPVGKAVEQRLDAFFAEWLRGDGRHHVSLLGDFGTGKSWFCRRFAYQQACRYLADPEVERAPMLISLRDYSKAYDIGQVITDALVNQSGVSLGAGYQTFQYLNDHGRMLLIFDGFDEMERRIGDYRTTREAFEELSKVVTARSKVLLTCRTAYFRHRDEERQVLEPHVRARLVDQEQIIDLESREGFEVAHLQLFDDAELGEALRKRVPQSWERVFARIKEIHDLPNLAQRPVLLEMITQTLDQLQADAPVNQATLYEDYTTRLMNRRASIDGLEPEQRRFFVEELAWDMNQRQRLTLRFDEFPEHVKRYFQLEDKPQAAAFLERDIRTQTYVRDEEGNYSFGHASFGEFFVARRLYALLKNGKGEECRVNEAIRGFVVALAELEPYEYQQVPAPPGMVYIPPGPFFFGEGPDLRIAALEPGVFIDRAPVSIGEYLEFVSWVGKSGRKGHHLCHPNEPRKKNHHPHVAEGQLPNEYFVSPKYRGCPIVGIDWFDAYAFAAWKGQRLPTEVEWEKTARGPFGRTYPWGEKFDRALANSAEHWGGKDLSDFDSWKRWWESPAARKAMPTEPGEFDGHSPYGCIDMAGNVWEWTASLYAEDKEFRVVRGGAFVNLPQFLRAAFRLHSVPGKRYDVIGFRCAQDPVKP